MPLVVFFSFNHGHFFGQFSFRFYASPIFFPALLHKQKLCLCVVAYASKRKTSRQSVLCVCVCAACMHVLFFLERTPEWTRGSAGWGVAVCDNGTGGDFNLPGRVTREQEEGMTLCVQMLFFLAIVSFLFF